MCLSMNINQIEHASEGAFVIEDIEGPEEMMAL